MRNVAAFFVCVGAALLAILLASSSPHAQPVTSGQGLSRVVHDTSMVGSGTTAIPLGLRRNCATNEILKWNGSTWACDDDDTGGTIADFVLADVSSHANLAAGTLHDVTPTDWATNTRHYLGGDATSGSTVTGFDDLPVGTIRFIELGDRNSKGPITLLPYDHATSTGSLGANRIVTPDNQPLRVDPGGMFAMVYIGGGPLHGWRVLWSTTTANPRIGLKHLRFYDALAGTLPSGVTNNWAPTDGLDYTRWRITVDVNGSTLHGITHNSSSTPGIGDGEIRILENVGDGIGSVTAMLTLAHMGAGTASDNSFFLPNAANVVLPPNGSAIFVRDSTLDAWRMVSSTTTANFNRGPALTPTALPSGDTNDWNPTGFANHTRIRVTPNAAGSTLTGMLAGKDGEIKILEVLYAPGGSLTLAEYRTSAGANSYVLPGLVDLVIPPGGSVIMVYDNTLQIWKVAGLAGSAGGGSGDITDVTVTSPACSAGSYMTTLTGGSTSGSAPVGGTCTAEVGDISSVGATASMGLTGGATSGAATLGLLSTCSDGQVLKSGGTGTTWTCAADTDTNSGGDITDVGAGAGLINGATSGAATVDVGAGANITVNANDVALSTNVAIAGTLSVLAGAATVADFRGTVISPSVTGTHTAYAPTGIATATVIDLQPTGSVDLVGLTTGATGRIITIRNANNIGYNVTIYDEGGTAAAGDRFDLGADTHWIIKAGDAMTFVYTSASRWASIGHVGRQYPGLFLTGDLAMGGANITGALNYTGTGTIQGAKITSETQRADFTRGFETFHEFLNLPKDDSTWYVLGTPTTDYAYASNRPGTFSLKTEGSGIGLAQTNVGLVQGDRAAVPAGGSSFFVTGGKINAEWAVLLDTTIPTASPSYEVVVGAFDEFGDATPSDGIYCLADNASANWQVCTSENNTRTCADTSPVVAKTADRWIKCAFEVNAAGTSVAFTVTDMTSGTVGTATSVTNIPNDSAHPVGIGAQNIRLGTSGGGAIQVDYAWLKQTFTVAR